MVLARIIFLAIILLSLVQPSAAQQVQEAGAGGSDSIEYRAMWSEAVPGELVGGSVDEQLLFMDSGSSIAAYWYSSGSVRLIPESMLGVGDVERVIPLGGGRYLAIGDLGAAVFSVDPLEAYARIYLPGLEGFRLGRELTLFSSDSALCVDLEGYSIYRSLDAFSAAYSAVRSLASESPEELLVKVPGDPSNTTTVGDILRGELERLRVMIEENAAELGLEVNWSTESYSYSLALPVSLDPGELRQFFSLDYVAAKCDGPSIYLGFEARSGFILSVNLSVEMINASSGEVINASVSSEISGSIEGTHLYLAAVLHIDPLGGIDVALEGADIADVGGWDRAAAIYLPRLDSSGATAYRIALLEHGSVSLERNLTAAPPGYIAFSSGDVVGVVGGGGLFILNASSGGLIYSIGASSVTAFPYRGKVYYIASSANASAVEVGSLSDALTSTRLATSFLPGSFAFASFIPGRLINAVAYSADQGLTAVELYTYARLTPVVIRSEGSYTAVFRFGEFERSIELEPGSSEELLLPVGSRIEVYSGGVLRASYTVPESPLAIDLPAEVEPPRAVRAELPIKLSPVPRSGAPFRAPWLSIVDSSSTYAARHRISEPAALDAGYGYAVAASRYRVDVFSLYSGGMVRSIVSPISMPLDLDLYYPLALVKGSDGSAAIDLHSGSVIAYLDPYSTLNIHAAAVARWISNKVAVEGFDGSYIELEAPDAVESAYPVSRVSAIAKTVSGLYFLFPGGYSMVAEATLHAWDWSLDAYAVYSGGVLYIYTPYTGLVIYDAGVNASSIEIYSFGGEYGGYIAAVDVGGYIFALSIDSSVRLLFRAEGRVLDVFPVGAVYISDDGIVVAGPSGAPAAVVLGAAPPAAAFSGGALAYISGGYISILPSVFLASKLFISVYVENVESFYVSVNGTVFEASGSAAIYLPREGVYNVSVSAPLHINASRLVAVSMGSPHASLRLRLEPVRFTLAIAAVDQLGQVNATARILDQGGRRVAEVEVPGSIELPFGNYTVSIDTPYHQPASMSVELLGDRAVLFRLNRTAIDVEIRVVDAATGEPVPNATVAIPGVGELYTGPEGSVAARLPFMQEVALAVFKEKYGLVERVVVANSSRIEVSIARLYEDLVVRVASNGGPVPGAEVSILYVNGSASSLAGADGIAVFPNIPLNTQVSINASAPGYRPKTADVLFTGGPVEIELEPALCRLIATAVDEAGAGPPRIDIVSEGGALIYSNVTYQAVLDVPQGSYRVSVYPSPPYMPGEQVVRCVGDQADAVFTAAAAPAEAEAPAAGVAIPLIGELAIPPTIVVAVLAAAVVASVSAAIILHHRRRRIYR